eukprot:2630965-Prymnesium_polylepis.1
MHRRSGGAGTACLGRTPSVGTRVLSSVSAFGGCSFALRVQHVHTPDTGGRAESRAKPTVRHASVCRAHEMLVRLALRAPDAVS